MTWHVLTLTINLVMHSRWRAGNFNHMLISVYVIWFLHGIDMFNLSLFRWTSPGVWKSEMVLLSAWNNTYFGIVFQSVQCTCTATMKVWNLPQQIQCPCTCKMMHCESFGQIRQRAYGDSLLDRRHFPKSRDLFVSQFHPKPELHLQDKQRWYFDGVRGLLPEEKKG